MTNEEKTSLKAACLQAATTLIAARDCGKGAVDMDECMKLAAELYCRLTAMNWWPGEQWPSNPVTGSCADRRPG